ncbi:hypothetical protein IJ768_00735 [Candidatus Saccharibacteria bacterium]|nr:hypothetical protein [Candidatus Saccharibacteria bacterium]
MKTTIFGAGVFGTALGAILEENGHTVEYYDPVKYPEKGLTEATTNSEINILACPSHAAPKLMLFLPHDKPLICASKGFLTDASFKPWGANFSILSGGAFAADLMQKHPAVLTATSPLVKELFKTSWLEFDETTDNVGVLICGALKNIYAIGSGYWGLTYGSTDFDDFINSALTEMKAIVQENGGKPATVDLSCGLRDLVITCASATSRNYDFGTKLKKDPELGLKYLSGAVRLPTTEGITTVAQIPRTPSFKKTVSTPILDRIIALINNEPYLATTTGEEQNTGEEKATPVSQPTTQTPKPATPAPQPAAPAPNPPVNPAS